MWGEIPHNLINTVCSFEHTRVYPPLLCTLSMEQKMCTKEYDSEMRYDCRCERCRLTASVEKVEKKLTLFANEYNKLSEQYHSHLSKIYEKHPRGFSYSVKVDNNYDEKSKAIYARMKELDKLSQRQIWRLTRLERKLDLINEDEYYSQQYA